MLSVTALWPARTPHIADLICLRIDLGIDNLPGRKASLTTGMNTHPLLAGRERSQSRFTLQAAEGEPGPIATQCIAIVMGKKVTTGLFLLTDTARRLMTLAQCSVTERTSRMEHEAVGRICPSKGRCRENLLACPAAAVRLLKMPVLPFPEMLFLRLSQNKPSFPFSPLSFLPIPLLPHISLDLYAAMALLSIPLLTLATDLPPFLVFALA